MPESPDILEVLKRLGVALIIGLLIGTERGWHDRAAEPGSRPAGVRTFAVIGLLGGLWSLLAATLGDILLGFAFLGFSILITAAHVLSAQAKKTFGITTMMAAFATFALGAIAVRGQLVAAAAAAVVMTILLGLKPVLNDWVERLERSEVHAAFKLLLISVVLLPVLPDRTVDPFNAINPYQIWWMVVLIAGISFIGYFAIKIAGPKPGTGLMGFFGGLASSTALTLSFSRFGKQNAALHRLLAAGVVIASATMFPRVLVVVGVVNAALMKKLLLPFCIMSAIGYAGAAWLWWKAKAHGKPGEPLFKNPLELSKAIQFGILLATVMVLVRLVRESLGDEGIFAFAALSGLFDTDAISLSLAKMSNGGEGSLAQNVAEQALIIATLVNTALKGALVALICGGSMSKQVNIVFALMIIFGICWIAFI